MTLGVLNSVYLQNSPKQRRHETQVFSTLQLSHHHSLIFTITHSCYHRTPMPPSIAHVTIVHPYRHPSLMLSSYTHAASPRSCHHHTLAGLPPASPPYSVLLNTNVIRLFGLGTRIGSGWALLDVGDASGEVHEGAVRVSLRVRVRQNVPSSQG